MSTKATAAWSSDRKPLRTFQHTSYRARFNSSDVTPFVLLDNTSLLHRDTLQTNIRGFSQKISQQRTKLSKAAKVQETEIHAPWLTSLVLYSQTLLKNKFRQIISLLVCFLIHFYNYCITNSYLQLFFPRLIPTSTLIRRNRFRRHFVIVNHPRYIVCLIR